MELREMAECQNADFGNRRRKLEDNNQNQNQNQQQQEIEYFMGPYCAEDGGAIMAGQPIAEVDE